MTSSVLVSLLLIATQWLSRQQHLAICRSVLSTTHLSSRQWRVREYKVTFELDENSPVGSELGSLARPLFVDETSTTTEPTSTVLALTYTLSQPSSLFKVNPITGVLTSKTEIDAEELCSRARRGRGDVERQQKVIEPVAVSSKINPIDDRLECSSTSGRLQASLDVNAVSSSDSSLRAVHHVTVIIHDLNDNSPQFTQVRWHKRVKEALYRRGRRLELPEARDADLLAEHRRVQYRLEESSRQSPATTKHPFRLEVSPSGQPSLILTQDLDAEQASWHNLVLVASSPLNGDQEDHEGRKSGHNSPSRLELNIEVADMNDNEPRFDQTVYTTSVSEDTPIDSVIYQLEANDPDSTARLTYRLAASDKPTSLTNFMFKVEVDGRVRLKHQLDFERHQRYEVPVEVNDGEFSGQARLVVNVVDVNDEAPGFDVNPKQLIVDENSAIGKVIGRVTVHDPDSSDVNGDVHCHEPDGWSRQQLLLFSPDPSLNPSAKVYDLTTRVQLDRESSLVGGDSASVSSFIRLICSDGHGAGSAIQSSRHTSTLTTQLIVRDVNDNAPLFSIPTYHTLIEENNVIGDKIVQVNASDADEGVNAQLTYSLLDRVNFNIDPVTGWITASTVFDRETRDSYQVTVRASDHGSPPLTSSVLVNVTIVDTNDHRPQLVSPTFDASDDQLRVVSSCNTFVVRENLPGGSYLGDVSATDGDLGVNALLKFELVFDAFKQKQYDRFQLLRNGSLYVKVPLDREEMAQYRLVVQVSDSSSTEPFTSTGTILILVQDVNDNSPEFDGPEGLLSEDANADRQLIQGRQSDQILYDQPDWPMGEGLPRKHVVNTDHDGEAQQKPTIRLSVREQVGFVAGQLTAHDPDQDQNGRLEYELFIANNHRVDDSRHHPIVRLHPFQGHVIVARSLSLDDLGLHAYRVTVKDGGKPKSLESSKLMLLLVEDTPPTADDASNKYHDDLSSYQHDVNTSSLLLPSSSSSSTLLSFWSSWTGSKQTILIVSLAGSSVLLLFSLLITSMLCMAGRCRNSDNGSNDSDENSQCGRIQRRFGRAQLHRTRQLDRRPSTSPGASDLHCNGNVGLPPDASTFYFHPGEIGGDQQLMTHGLAGDGVNCQCGGEGSGGTAIIYPFQQREVEMEKDRCRLVDNETELPDKSSQPPKEHSGVTYENTNASISTFSSDKLLLQSTNIDRTRAANSPIFSPTSVSMFSSAAPSPVRLVEAGGILCTTSNSNGCHANALLNDNCLVKPTPIVAQAGALLAVWPPNTGNQSTPAIHSRSQLIPLEVGQQLYQDNVTSPTIIPVSHRLIATSEAVNSNAVCYYGSPNVTDSSPANQITSSSQFLLLSHCQQQPPRSTDDPMSDSGRGASEEEGDHQLSPTIIQPTDFGDVFYSIQAPTGKLASTSDRQSLTDDVSAYLQPAVTI